MKVARFGPTPICGKPPAVPSPYDVEPGGMNMQPMMESTMQYGRQLRGLGGGGGHHGGHHGGGHHGGGRHWGGGGRHWGGYWGGYPYMDYPYTGFIETVVADCGPNCIFDGYSCVCPDMPPKAIKKEATPVKGLGAVPISKYHHDSWSGDDPAVLGADEQDDAVGNGIFDGAGAAPVQHAGNGVFESHYAEPGYLYRERMGQPSEVLDATTGNPIVYHPNAGQSSHEDILRTYRRWDLETPRHYGRPRAPLQGLGVDSSETASLAPYAVGGLLIGVALGIAYDMWKKGRL